MVRQTSRRVSAAAAAATARALLSSSLSDGLAAFGRRRRRRHRTCSSQLGGLEPSPPLSLPLSLPTGMEGTQTPPAWSVSVPPRTAGAAHARNSLNAHRHCCEARLPGRGRSVSREGERKSSVPPAFPPSFRSRPFIIIILAATSEERRASETVRRLLASKSDRHSRKKKRSAGERPREAALPLRPRFPRGPSSSTSSPTELRGRAPRSSPTASIARPSPSPSPFSFLSSLFLAAPSPPPLLLLLSLLRRSPGTNERA